MSKFSSSTAQTKEKIKDSLASMTPRDRMLLAGTFGTIFIIAAIIGIYYLLSSLTSMKEELASVKSYTQQIQLLGSELKDVKNRRSELEQKVNEQKSTDLSAFLSKSTQKANIKDKILDRVKEKSSANMGLFTQKSYSVPLRELSLKDFTSFLFAIETSDYPFEIQNCSIRTRKRGEEQKLRVELDIVTYQLNTNLEVEQ